MTCWTRTSDDDETMTIQVNGTTVPARPDDTVATVLLRLGYRSFGQHPVTGAALAPACLMGVCFGCLCQIDGRPGVQACLERVHEGQSVVTTPASSS